MADLEPPSSKRAAPAAGKQGAQDASGAASRPHDALRSEGTPEGLQATRPIARRFERTASAAELAARFGELGPGEETDVRVSVAGRVMLLRLQGRVAFATMRDWTGQVQLFARADATEDFEGFTRLVLGDWVGATGRVVTTRRGELSVLVERFVLLAHARRSFGDKWHGIHDPDVRLRHREADLWANDRSRRVLLERSRLVAAMRRWLSDRGFVEVETPVLHPIPGGALARPFVTHHEALDCDLYLRVAPELYLKRLVVGGFERVFEIGRVFRNEGLSPRHNPEFTILELYQAYADYTDLFGLVESLVADLALELTGSTTVSWQGHEVDLAPPWPRATLASLVSSALGRPLDVHSERDELAEALRQAGDEPDPEWGRGKLLLELYEKLVERELLGPMFVVDFPVEVSPLARRRLDDPELVERFEVVIGGQELVNAFSELADPDDQRERFMAEAHLADRGHPEAMGVDWDYLQALEWGLPPTAGLGLGVDRLAMLLTDTANIREVIAFPTLRPRAPTAW
jgi:lysyl-tRNA synthetase class 2